MEDQDLVGQFVIEQPTRKGTQRRPRRFDKTSLHEEVHGRRVHRDYAAHFFRWGFIHRHLDKGDRVLDVGCGPEAPLPRILSGYQPLLPELYLGVDLNIIYGIKAPWARYRSIFDFVNYYPSVVVDYGQFNKVVCLEVIEHMMLQDARGLLKGIHHCMSETGTLYLSTPVFDGWRAANHLHEFTIAELKQLLHEAGFVILYRFGTFINLPALEKVMSDAERVVYTNLSTYYGGEVLSAMFAPLHPEESRNNLWICKKNIA